MPIVIHLMGDKRVRVHAGRWRPWERWVARIIVKFVRPWSVNQQFRMDHVRIEGIIGTVTARHTRRVGWTMMEWRGRTSQRSLVMVLRLMVKVSLLVRNVAE